MAKTKTLPNIEYGEDTSLPQSVPYIDAINSLYTIPFWKDDEYFSNLDSYQKFIKAVEKLVRTSDRYAKYKSYLVKEVGLDHCQVFTDIVNNDGDKKDATLEMHHGPIFTLYDYCCIILEYFIMMKWKISTFRVADQVLQEHEENHIQVVMLSSTVHEQVHARNVFISPEQAWGDLNAFIKKYAKAIGPDMRNKFNRYIDRAMLSESNDYGTFDLNDKIYLN